MTQRLTASLEDYLEAIHVLIRSTGCARVRDVAADLNVKMPSVVKAMAELKKIVPEDRFACLEGSSEN